MLNTINFLNDNIQIESVLEKNNGLFMKLAGDFEDNVTRETRGKRRKTRENRFIHVLALDRDSQAMQRAFGREQTRTFPKKSTGRFQ